MILGALLDAGLPLDALRGALGSLAIEHGAIGADRVTRAGVSATKFRTSASEPAAAAAQGHHHHHEHGHHHESVEGQGEAHAHAHEASQHQHHHHSLQEIAACIDRSALSRTGKDRARHLFDRLAEAEAAIHDVPLDRIHLHEVGALDSIIDIVGVVYGMEWLGLDEVMASPLNVGSGTVKCAHGTFPVPAPATARLLRGVPIYAGEVQAELVTLPLMRVDVIGYGAGDREFKGHPNVLRLLVGEMGAVRSVERIVTMECEIDDMNPQLFGPLMDRLYAAGALDVFYSAVQMKKNRPGTLVTVIASPDNREAIASALFTETTTIGVRYQEMMRERLEREIRTIETPVGPIRFKIASRDGRVLNAAPEFDDCVRAAAERQLSIKDVQAQAMKAWLDR
jgi:hypothetical protein